MATLKSIAEEAGVTPMVVSAVVKNDFSRIRVSKETRRRVRELIEKHNYVPNALARSLSRKASFQIIAFIPSFRFFEIPFQNKLMTSFQKHLEPAGYRIAFCSYNVNSENITDVIADAGIFFYYGSPHYEKIKQIRALRFPLLIFGDCLEDEEALVVYRDNFTATYNLTKRLIGMGHRDILYIYSHDGDVYNHAGRVGLEQAVNEAGGRLSRGVDRRLPGAQGEP
ncbi:MAG: LacI family transcriptional regulator [Lentisphaerae bacterium]|nr:MAG: LacI family transcriptional regulator [Lentisphaerota bacterium]